MCIIITDIPLFKITQVSAKLLFTFLKTILLQTNETVDVYNENTARQACLRVLDRPVFRLCQNVPDLDVEPYIDSCAKDAVVREGILVIN